MQPGDVVFGIFPANGKTLADHHSIVVALEDGKAMLVYTTSIKPGEPEVRRALSREFTSVERELAKWKNRCRYDATMVALVPVEKLTRTGRVPAATVRELNEAIMKAARDKRLQMFEYDSSLPEVVTGQVARAKREAAFH